MESGMWRRIPGFMVTVGLFAVAASSCSSAHSSTTPTTAATPALSSAAATKLASQITSPTPSVRQAAVVPQLASQLGSTPLLAAGTMMSIDVSTFKGLGSSTATVQASTTGTEAGTWTLALVDDAGTWQLIDAEPAS